MPAYIKLLMLARSGWKRLPPEQRRRIVSTAGQQARRHGPTVARGVETVVRNVRKAK